MTTAFQYAKENVLRVDVICPLAKHLVESRPEFKALSGSDSIARSNKGRGL